MSAVLIAVILCSMCVGRNDQPCLIVVAVETPLANLCVGVRLASFDVERFSLRKGLDVACFSSPFSFGGWHDMEEAAVELSMRNLDDTSIPLIFILNMESSVCSIIDEGVFEVVLKDLEVLSWGSGVVGNNQLVTLGWDGKGLVSIQDTNYLIADAGIWREELILRSLHLIYPTTKIC